MSAPTQKVEVWLALEARLRTLSTTPTMALVEPDGIIPQPTKSGALAPVLLVSDIRDTPERQTIGGGPHLLSGTLQISVAWPIARPISHAALLQIAGAVAAHFPADLRMRYGAACLRVTQQPDEPAPYTEGPYRYAPVRVPWRNA